MKFQTGLLEFDSRDEDRVDEIVRPEIGGAGLPESERRVEISAVEDRLCWRLHLHPLIQKLPGNKTG